MMEDAKWRDEQRAGNVERYKEEDKERDRREKEKRAKEGGFLG